MPANPVFWAFNEWVRLQPKVSKIKSILNWLSLFFLDINFIKKRNERKYGIDKATSMIKELEQMVYDGNLKSACDQIDKIKSILETYKNAC